MQRIDEITLQLLHADIRVRRVLEWGLVFPFLVSLGCSIVATRPVQEMSDCTAAIRAAQEVQADALVPELFQQANEWFLKAKREYRFKNFYLARDYVDRARKLAEQAEFEAIRNGGVRGEPATTVAPEQKSENAGNSGTTEVQAPSQEESPSPPASEPYPYPTPSGIPSDVYDERMNIKPPDPAPTPEK